MKSFIAFLLTALVFILAGIGTVTARIFAIFCIGYTLAGLYEMWKKVLGWK